MITSELQEGIMKTRMQPIDHIWSKLPRVVRDLSNSLGKQVQLAMEGKETELDRSLLEAVKDPLTHLVRNAVDHGIEDAGATRVAAGKDAEGTLTLRAYHEGGHVAVEVADDGAGIDVDRIAQKAVESGLLRAEQIAQHGQARHHGDGLPARLLHRRQGHQRVRPRRRHGRGQDQHRAHRRRGRRRLDASARARSGGSPSR